MQQKFQDKYNVKDCIDVNATPIETIKVAYAREKIVKLLQFFAIREDCVLTQSQDMDEFTKCILQLNLNVASFLNAVLGRVFSSTLIPRTEKHGIIWE